MLYYKKGNSINMPTVDYLILGGGVAGTTAAETIRKYDTASSITIIEAEQEPLYSKVMLTDLLKGTVKEEQLRLRRAEQYQEKNIVLKFAQITKIDPQTKTVTLSDGETVQGGLMLIALGTKPRPFSVPGGNLKGIYHVRNLANTRQAVAALSGTREAVIVGGGFVGLEAYEAMVNRKIKTTMLVRDPWYFYPRIGQVEGQMISDIVSSYQVPISFEDECVEVVGTDRVTHVKTKKGLTIPCQMIILGIGVLPNIELLRSSALTVDDQGVSVNCCLETNVSGIWAAGDIANFDDVLSGTKHTLGNWSNAAGQGMLAGQNMATARLKRGDKKEFRIVSAYTITAPGINLSFLGDTSDGIRCDNILLSDKNQFIKLFVDRERGNLVGAVLLNNPQVLGILHQTVARAGDIRSKVQVLKETPANLAVILS